MSIMITGQTTSLRSGEITQNHQSWKSSRGKENIVLKVNLVTKEIFNYGGKI